MRPALVIAITLVVGLDMTPAHADCTSEASTLRHHLVDEARRADAWNTAWALGFAFGGVLQLGVTETEFNPTNGSIDTYRTSLRIGAAKSLLGMTARVVLPLRLAVPEPVADPCDDAHALRRAVRKAARKEQRSIWLTLIGSAAVNLAGAVYLWIAKDSPSNAIGSFLVGAPVGVVSALTQPRNSLRLYKKRKVEWVVGIGSIGARF